MIDWANNLSFSFLLLLWQARGTSACYSALDNIANCLTWGPTRRLPAPPMTVLLNSHYK